MNSETGHCSLCGVSFDLSLLTDNGDGIGVLICGGCYDELCEIYAENEALNG